MRNRFVISESDRRSILSLHGLLLFEEVKKINLQLTIDDILGAKELMYYILSGTTNSEEINNIVVQGKATDTTNTNTAQITETLDLEEGDYTLKVTSPNKNNEDIIIPFKVDQSTTEVKLPNSKFKNIEPKTTESMYSTFNIVVKDTGNTPLGDSEITLFIGEKIIDYQVLVYQDKGFTINNQIKKTDNNGILKNVFIDKNKISEFQYTQEDVCVEKQNINIKVLYKGNSRLKQFDVCKTSSKFNVNQDGSINTTKNFQIVQEQNVNFVFNLNDQVQIQTYEIDTRERIGPLSIEVYNDQAKTQFLGNVKINENGLGIFYVGGDKFGVTKISENDETLIPTNFGKKDLFFYSFESGYNEFFKKYSFEFLGNGNILPIKLEVDYVDKNDKEEDIDFNKKSNRYVFYGKSSKKFRTKEESINDAKKDALSQFLKKSKRYKDDKDLQGVTPDGGKLVVLKNHDDGTFTAIVKFKRRELRKFASTYSPEPPPKPVVPKKEIEFKNVLISEARKDGDVLIFVLGKDSNTSNELYNNIIYDIDLSTYINDNYTNIRVYNDKEDINYYEVVNNYKVEGVPTVILDTKSKNPYHFNNFKGDIYQQMKNYFKV